ncbi:ABC transporter permease [Croceicoccus estronivorus]|uniref:DUF4198 domain-containing protein n=1 Tax=Croceicoccus estronivorus TaxID=1172626 RepID=UPI000830A6A9|nr:DUF4198 domain-containing protein [Croceicoccus estronivorus]OCC24164.1 ABC transporter permease [Croceicoccus estronivorus]
MKFRIALAAAALLSLPAAVQAHNAWILPSSTVLSGDESWVTVDAAVSNDLFYFNHNALRLDNMQVWRPDGSEAELENQNTGHYRSTFDVHLDQQGTWKIGFERKGIFGRYTLDGKQQRLPRGASADQLESLIPAGATDVQISENAMRNETFVTLGAPTETVFKPSGKGLEFLPVTHPNDLVAGEPALFRFIIDGQPAAGLKVVVTPGGSRYRNSLDQIALETNAAGEVSITWPQPGMYWLEAEAEDGNSTIPGATERRLGYVSTLEVMTP